MGRARLGFLESNGQRVLDLNIKNGHFNFLVLSQNCHEANYKLINFLDFWSLQIWLKRMKKTLSEHTQG